MTSIIQFSDIHFGVEDKEAVAAIAATVKTLKPDVTVICGDITQNGKIDEFFSARDWIKSLPGPKVITDWSLGVVDMDELDTVINNLKATLPSTLKMIAVHHPLIYPPISPLQKETEKGAEALMRLSQLNIDAVLSGHVHAPFVLERQPDETEIMSIGSGTLSVRRRDKPASFNHLLVNSETIQATEIFWQDGKFSTAEPWIKKIAELKSRRPQ